MGRPRRPLEERFWEKVDVQGPSECWPWTAFREPKMGYGKFQVPNGRNGKSVGAHAVAYELHNGAPAEKWVLHTCDNPPCCNPAHLYDGTPGDNTRDRDQRGRTARGPNPAKGHRGESHSLVKLTDDQVREIRELYARGSWSQSRLGKRYGVHQAHISRIVRGTQRHL